MHKLTHALTNKIALSKQEALHRTKIIGWATTGLGLFGVVIYSLVLISGLSATKGDILLFALYGLTTLLGYYLLKLKATAFSVFRYLIWLNVIFGGLYVVMMLVAMFIVEPFMFNMFIRANLGSVFGGMILLGFILNLVTPIASLAFLIMTNRPEVRKLYR